MPINCSKQALLDSLKGGDETWLQWAKGLRAIHWHQKTDNMIGSTRKVEMVGGDHVEETFFIWDEDGHVAFYVTESTLKPVSAFAESYRFEVTGDNSLNFTWSVAIEAGGFNGFMMKLFKPVMGMMFKGWVKKLKASLEK